LPSLRLKLPNHVDRFIPRNVRRSLYSLWRYVKTHGRIACCCRYP